MLQLRNEFIVPPLKLGYTTGDGKVNKRHLDFYGQRSKYAGAVVIEPFYLDKGLRELPTQLGIDSDDKLEGLKELNDLIHRYGAKTIAHLNHPGRMAHPKIPGNYFWSSTGKACENGGATPVAMDRHMMDKVTGLFTETAQRAEKADFDFIELQLGHGYLMAQFLSPAVNKREDEYNGSLENRARFPLEVLQAVKNAVNIPVIARISGEEMMPGGFGLEEMRLFSRMVEKTGVAALHITAGSVCSTPPWFFQHMFIPKGKTWQLASEIKKEVSIPIIYVGQINTFEDIKTLKKEHRAEFIAVGRALVADPDFIGKYQGKVEGNVRPCLACSEGCLGNVKQGKGLGCVVNPTVNTTLGLPQPADRKKQIAIVGGGLAGLQAAVTLSERGHNVTLYEKGELGGQFNLAHLPPQKNSLKKIVDFYKKEIERLPVKVIYEEATAEKLKKASYDEVVMATGAIPVIPPIEGLTEYYWTEFLKDDQLPENQKVLIIGGGLIGVEMASKLVDNGNKVIIVEMLDEVARGMEILERKFTLNKLKEKKVEIFTGLKARKVEGSKVTLENKEHKTLEINGVDKIIISTGMRSYIPFEKDGLPGFYKIGDAQQPRKAEDAIREGYSLALKL